MNEPKDIQQLVIEFTEAREWKHFHNLKDLALSLNLEAAEVLEHFQWKTEEESRRELGEAKKRAELSGELADVYYWLILMSHYLEIDLEQAVRDKMIENERKYPADKARGRSTKYTELS